MDTARRGFSLATATARRQERRGRQVSSAVAVSRRCARGVTQIGSKSILILPRRTRQYRSPARSPTARKGDPAVRNRSREHRRSPVERRASRAVRVVTVAGVCALALPVHAADTVLVPAGAEWKYLDNGSNQGTAWRGAGFDDSAWKSGLRAARLRRRRRGDGRRLRPRTRATSTSRRISGGLSTLPAPGAFTSLTLRLIRDDGAVVYVNGAEVFRTNMPAGTIAYTTPATAGDRRRRREHVRDHRPRAGRAGGRRPT